ncbi:hypothetical protein MNBD_GAMMA15-200 [hydrothermal vent metagenome]|uniref:Glycosyltransferase 2-like domain-containing protein n=1 Tax=hydrothermal vent metagenome TaxID=652676 RepID=A0A3B0ZCQ8_9ZZZZ
MNNESPQLVSVVIPTYNRARLLTAAIDSALAQDYPATEILVIDDGSTDHTADLVAGYGEKVRYFQQANRGAGAARNFGIQQARGEFIAFLDSDDMWRPDKLTLQVSIMNARPDVAMLFSEFDILRESGETQLGGMQTWLEREVDWGCVYQETLSPETWRFPVRIGDIYTELLGHIFVLTSSTVVRRSCLDDSMRFAEDLALFEDWEFFARVARKHLVAFMDTATTFNRGHSDEVRLTRCDIATKATTRLKLVERLWASDDALSEAAQRTLDKVRSEQWLILAKQAVLTRQPAQSRSAVRNYFSCRGIHFPDPVWPVAALAYIPFLANAWLSRSTAHRTR